MENHSNNILIKSAYRGVSFKGIIDVLGSSDGICYYLNIIEEFPINLQRTKYIIMVIVYVKLGKTRPIFNNVLDYSTGLYK
jgi:hypothetical protein